MEISPLSRSRGPNILALPLLSIKILTKREDLTEQNIRCC
jgi:hypothetical protein